MIWTENNKRKVIAARALLAGVGIDLTQVLDDAYEYRHSGDDDEDGRADDKVADRYGEAYNILIAN